MKNSNIKANLAALNGVIEAYQIPYFPKNSFRFLNLRLYDYLAVSGLLEIDFMDKR